MVDCRRTPDEIRDGLKALYDKIAVQNQDQIGEIIEHVALVMLADTQPIGRTRLAFRTCGTATTKKELAKIKELASGIAERIVKSRALTDKKRQSLADRLETLHKPTIDALANSRAPLNVGALRLQFPQIIRKQQIEPGEIRDAMHLIVAACESAKIIETSDEGPPQHRRDQVVSRMLANAFATLTGKEPTISVIKKTKYPNRAALVAYAGSKRQKPALEPGPTGPFYQFMDDAFEIIGLRVSSDPLHMAKFAIADRKNSRARKRRQIFRGWQLKRLPRKKTQPLTVFRDV